MDNQNIFYIAGLIAGYIQGNLTPEQQEELDVWRRSSAEHERLLEEFRRSEFLEKKQIAERLCGKEKAYLAFRRRQEIYLQRKQLRLQWSRGIAAVAVLFIGIAVVFWYRTREVVSPVLTEQFLSAGQSQAVLTLADGRKMNLGKGIADTLLQDKEVTMTASGESIVYNSRPVEKMELVYNQLDIPRKGEYKLVLADGSKVWLNAESQLRYPVNFQGEERRVYLKGEAYFEVRRNEKMPFIVETETSAIQVLGTSFNVRAYADEAFCYTTLVEGSVRLSSGKQTLLLKPYEQGIVDLSSGQIDKKTVDVRLYTAWKDGRFAFENQTLEEIMQTLCRWYDVNVFYTNEQVKEALFIGNLKRYDNFDQIVKMLEMTGVAHFQIKGNTIIISE